MPTCAANGIEIYYERWGEGPPLLFFNGSGTSLATTRPMIEPYGERFQVAAHDQRGLGETGVTPGPYEMADYAADGAALLDHLGWDRCRVVGVSFGGMVAQEFAVTYPERVERLALVCTSPGGDFASYPLHTLADMDPAEAGAMRLTLIDTRYTPEFLAEHDADRALAEFIAGGAAAPPSDEVQRGMAMQLDARSRHDVVDRLGNVTCPTLVAGGQYDGIAPPANSEAIAARVPGAEIRLYEGGHMFFIQDPAAQPEILDFLAG